MSGLAMAAAWVALSAIPVSTQAMADTVVGDGPYGLQRE